MTMLKKLVAGMIALTVAGAGLALAQPAPPRDAPRWRPSAEDIAAFTDARIAALRAGLKLTAEQEKNWPAIESALREVARQRADRMKELAERREARDGAQASGQPQPDAIASLRRRADAMSTRAAALKRLADAAEPLYRSLDDGQKRRFSLLLRMGGRPGLWQRRSERAR
jgi:hypothetical protein